MSNSANLSDIENRLASSFEAVFPGLSPEQARSADQDSLDEWDSVATISLVNVIEEEFGIDLDFEEAVELTSFRAIADHLARKTTR